MPDTFAIEFNEAEIEKLQKIATSLKGAAGQNPEWNELADWLASVVNDDDSEAAPDKPKRKTKK